MSEERPLKAFQAGGGSVLVAKTPGIDERYSEYRQLIARAVEVFGDDKEAARWLSQQNTDFLGRTPLQDFIEHGPEPVLKVLGRIEHGVFF